MTAMLVLLKLGNVNLKWSRMKFKCFVKISCSVRKLLEEKIHEAVRMDTLML
jgi:hypothetical protein